MATLNSFFQLMITFMLYCHFENVETTSECKRRPTDPKEMPQSRFELFHRHGLCSPTTEMNMPSTQDILEGDRLRVEFLQNRFKPKTNKYDSRFQDTKEEVNIPATVAGNIYAITISLGTPGQNLVLAFDTASDLTWMRCFHNDKLTRRNNVEFKPNDSTSFSSVSCTSELCTDLLSNHACVNFNNTNNTCSHDIQRVDGSHAKGVLSLDNLNIIETGDVFSNWIFVCATEVDNNENFNAVAGILGLGRNSPLSIVRETDQKYGRIFSYCIPSDTSLTGFLKLGKTDYPENLNFTPFITYNSNHPSLYYFIDVTSIRVGNSSIDTSELIYFGTIIDSGVSFTRLPMIVYKAMRDEFQKQMNSSGYSNFFKGGYDDYLDTCYDFSSNPNIIIPTITFTFKGDVTLELGVSATLYDAYSTIKCLAFVGYSNPNEPRPWGSSGTGVSPTSGG
ncbi:hypothetical protein CASFOL_041758 [Castilleja foliolosa]|uniref:Peptidase A1 domain-containing protein n=1 Tax=Castilleja foliolosa TaxID=1961234 RepID=A0ABD3B967_9LAMI